MSNIIRRITLFLLPIILLNCTSCGLVVINYEKFSGNVSESGVGTNKSETATEPTVTHNIVENDYSELIDSNMSKIPDTKYEGDVFKITSPDTSALNGDDDLEYLSEAASRRNNRVIAKHSISIITAKVDYTVLYSEVNTAVKSGMYYSDLIMLPQESVASFAAGNLILNMRSMPGLDFEASFFNTSSVGAASGGFNSYAIAGPASVYPFSLPAVFFNTDLCADADPYSLVESGEWTWDKFFEISIAAADNEYKFSWGTQDMGEAVYEAAFVSCGQQIIESGIMQVPALAFDAESSTGAVDIIKRLYSDENTIRTNSNATAYFNEGNGYFLIEKLSSMTSLRSSSVNWGVLPMPKASVDASYSSLAGTDSLMFSCPATVTTPEKSAIILMSLNAASDGIVKDAYIDYIQFNFLRDNESANMLDYIIDGMVYDFSYTFGGMYGGISDGTYNMIRMSALPDTSMGTLINKYKGTLDRTLTARFGLSN